MKNRLMSMIAICLILPSIVSAKTSQDSQLILKQDLNIEAKSTKQLAKKEINYSSCVMAIQNLSDQNLQIPRDTTLVVDKVLSGVRRLEEGFPEAEAITKIQMKIKEQGSDELVENVMVVLSCESGIYYTKDEARFAHVPAEKLIKKYKDFLKIAK